MIVVSGVKLSLEISCSSDGVKDKAVLSRGLISPSSSSSSIGPGADLARESFLRMRSKTGIVAMLVVPRYWRSKCGVGYRGWQALARVCGRVRMALYNRHEAQKLVG